MAPQRYSEAEDLLGRQMPFLHHEKRIVLAAGATLIFQLLNRRHLSLQTYEHSLAALHAAIGPQRAFYFPCIERVRKGILDLGIGHRGRLQDDHLAAVRNHFRSFVLVEMLVGRMDGKPHTDKFPVHRQHEVR